MKEKWTFLLILLLAITVTACGASTGGNAEQNQDGNTNENQKEASKGAYPSKTIQIIVPYSAGGPGDTTARILADALSKELDEQVNVVNKGGAGGETGLTDIGQARPDGYTLGVFGYPDNYILELTKDTDFSSESFNYLAAFDDVPQGIFVGPDSSFNSLDDLITYAKENPGEVTIGQSGALGKLQPIVLEEAAGIDVSTVAYDGGADLLNAMLGGHIDAASTSSRSVDQTTSSDGKILGFAAAERLEMYPDYPTFKELGYDMELGVAHVLVTPKDLPQEIKDVLLPALDKIGKDEAIKEKFKKAGLPFKYMPQEKINNYISERNDTIKPVVEENMESFTEGE